VVASPSSGHGEFCESMYVCGLSMHQKCFNYALTNLLFGLCKSIWTMNPLVICPSPHFETLTHPSYPWKVVNKKMYPNSFFHCFHLLDSHFNLSRSLGVCQLQLLVFIAMIFLCNKLFKWVNQVIFVVLKRPNSNMYTLMEDVIKTYWTLQGKFNGWMEKVS